MAISVLEMAKELVIAHLDTYHLSAGQVVQLLEKTHAHLMALQRQEETGTVDRETVSAAVDWRKSITRYTVTCLECGVAFKQLSNRHLEGHGLDRQSYRTKYGIPQSQALMARDMTARRRQVALQSRMWEKAPGALEKGVGR
jgi:predicted transcriptional regulator